MREYRRDVGRYVRGETDDYPLLPQRYFDSGIGSALTSLRGKAAACRNRESLAILAAASESAKIENTWQHAATRIYRNWLECICARKNESEGNRFAVAPLSLSR